ncbi:malonate decarboxylase subunit alpha [Alcaligenes faecalis subsp. faecalis NCIB 8687]|nr:malonate decarboxylase subunit alpha [Alcaligenes faecalis subsp. faecalis NCIB 8687]
MQQSAYQAQQLGRGYGEKNQDRQQSRQHQPPYRPHFIEPLFTRDPAQISEIQVLMAMMAIKGIYAEYGVQRLNHGIGFDTAAIYLGLDQKSPELKYSSIKGKNPFADQAIIEPAGSGAGVFARGGSRL